MPPLTPEEVYQRNAIEARRRDVTCQLARVRGQQDAAASASRHFAGVGQALQVERAGLEGELQVLQAGGGGLTDDWGKYSALELAAQEERYPAKSAAYDWLVAHPAATFLEAAGELERLMLEARTAAGRPWPLLRADGLLREWQANAFARGLVPGNTWEVFRDYLLSIGKDAALGGMV
ncbi:hypothetical protein [Myxococcus sp. AS-1-15]|uniref:hypothetical protein n=1 Tax=Myxococcus sp. AS-1-15 TaxID=2874600 RepID=UPI001CBC01D2|nr:hypothetical protein [Myxococcus sp. AS-1-15]MBZ4402425.1 hypothetical protein [Myxococcus sp. AS-1-15]